MSRRLRGPDIDPGSGQQPSAAASGPSRWTTGAVAALLIVAVLTTAYPSWALAAELAVLRTYRATVSPLAAHVVRCRYEPSCSEYAVDALRERGFWRGNAAIAARLVRCSPVGAIVEALGKEPDA